MGKVQIDKILKFAATTLFFVVFSFVVRNVLVSSFDGCDFKIISIEHIRNFGAAFSILQDHTTLLIVVSVIILLITLYFVLKNIQKLSKIDFLLTALLSAGIIGNLTERIFDGYVTDYIRLNFVTFPIFNVSDIFICTGAFMLICTILFNDDK